jgi:thiamine biosynthesis lipoprotein
MNSRRRFLRGAGLAVLSAAILPQSIFSRYSLFPLKRSRLSMGSVLEMTVFGESRSHCLHATERAFAEFDRVERLMSVFDERSQLSFVNRHSCEQDVEVDPSIVEVIEQARRVHTLTRGAFDPTIEPLMELYGFRDPSSHSSFPSDREIADTLDAVGVSNVTVNHRLSTVRFTHRKTRLDFGGIAVGYAIDRAVAVLRSEGIESALVNHSGDVFALAAPPDDDAWSIGIVDPLQTDSIITTVRVKDQALSTSGNYEKFVRMGDRTVGHLLDPATGFTTSSVLSGTVIAPTAIEADALSTGLYVAGTPAAEAILPQVPTARYVAVVTEDERIDVVSLP